MNMQLHYEHGGDIYRNTVKYDFSVNTNPLGMPVGSLEAAKRGVELSAYHYPDSRAQNLIEAAAAHCGVPPRQILAGSGAAELLYALCRFLSPKLAWIPSPAFQEYEEALRPLGTKIRFPLLEESEDFLPGEAFLEKLTAELAEGDVRQSRMLFLCNPNNPTGRTIPQTVLLRLLELCRQQGIRLCLDECFLPFLEPEEEKRRSCLQLLESYPNLVVLRAFTKIYGMPGLRLGCLFSADKGLLSGVRKLLQPWNTSLPAQMAGEAALRDSEYLQKTFGLIRQERAYLTKELREVCPVEKLYPSEANFLFFRGRADLKKRLLERGILIRSCANYRGLGEGYFRISIRTHQENMALVQALRELE